MPAFWNIAVESGFSNSPIPAVIDATELPDQMALAATWDPTREDEQAVSTLIDCPLKPKTYEIRPLATLRAPPVALYALTPTVFLATT